MRRYKLFHVAEILDEQDLVDDSEPKGDDESHEGFRADLAALATFE